MFLEDFETLRQLIAWFGKLITTPHVLSQVSDLTDLPGDDLGTVPKLFSRLGLTDVAIATVRVNFNHGRPLGWR